MEVHLREPQPSISFELHSLPVESPKFNVVRDYSYDGLGHCDFNDYGYGSGASTPYSAYSAVPMSTADVVLAFLRDVAPEDLGPPAVALVCRSRVPSMASMCSEQQHPAAEASAAAERPATTARPCCSTANPEQLPPWHPSRNPYWLAAGTKGSHRNHAGPGSGPLAPRAKKSKQQRSNSFVSISADCTAFGAAMTAAAAAALEAAGDAEECTQRRSGGLLGLGLGRLIRSAKSLLARAPPTVHGLPAADGAKADRHPTDQLTSQLWQRLQQVEAERDEALRLNAALQHKLTMLESSVALASVNQTAGSRSRELEQLLETVDKL